jgi:colanic acid/amylovoran biosynthesis protein
LFPKIFELLVTIALGRPFVLFTQSLGPFPRHQRALRFVLRRARRILVRDQRSRANLLRLGVPHDRIFECADAAFALSGTAACRQTEEPVPNRRLRVAVSVRNWPHFQGDSADAMDRYLDAVADTVTMLIERHDALVVFLSTCQGVGEYWTDDSAIAEKVIERLPPDLRKFMFVDCGFHTPNMLIEALGGYDLVIATRMHVAILAMCVGVPVLPIAYEFKTVELFTRLGLDEHVQHIESVSSPELCRAVENLLVSRLRLGKTLEHKIAKERRSAFAAGRHVAAALEGV